MGPPIPIPLADHAMAILAIALTFILPLALYRFLLPKPLPGIPYNPEATSSIFGDIPSMIKDESVMDWLLDQGRRQSGPICQLFIRPFSRPFVLISDFQEARDIMVRRPEWDRSDYSIEIFGNLVPFHHINQKTGPVWKTHRSLVTKLMSPEFLQNVAAPNIYTSTLQLIDLWTKKERLAAGRPFSAAEDIFHSSLDAVLAFTFGDSFAHRAIAPQIESLQGLNPSDVPPSKGAAAQFKIAPVHEQIEATLYASESLGYLMENPFPRLAWWFKSKMPYDSWAVRTRTKYLKEQILKSVDNLNRNTVSVEKGMPWARSAVDMMMEKERTLAKEDCREPVYWSPVTRDEVIGFVIAGHDTTSTTMLWGLKHLSDYQPAQEKLRAALRSHHPDALSEKRMPSAYEIAHAQIPYLDAVIEEILRLAGTVAILDRQTDEDTELFGCHIPKGTILLMLNRGPSFTEPAFQVDEKLRSSTSRKFKGNGGLTEWETEGMDAFIPERWLKTDKTDNEEKEVYNRTAGPSLPFGLGARGCYGRRLAYLEMRMIITLLVWKFHLQPCPPELSGYSVVESMTHKPKQCYVRLKTIPEVSEGFMSN